MRTPVYPPGSFAANRRTILYCALFVSFLLFLAACTSPTSKTPMADLPDTAMKKPTIPTNKDIYQIFNSGNYGMLDSIVAKDAIDHSFMGTVVGIDSLKANFAAAKVAFPDIKIEALEEAVNGDMIFTRFHMTGTNTGPFDTRPATGKKVDVTGVDVTRIKDGKLYEHWDYTDNMTYFKQLGFDPLASSPTKKSAKSK